MRDIESRPQFVGGDIPAAARQKIVDDIKEERAQFQRDIRKGYLVNKPANVRRVEREADGFNKLKGS